MIVTAGIEISNPSDSMLAHPDNLIGAEFERLWKLGRQYVFFRENYHRWRIPPPRGCLIYGPPGTGKSSAARTLTCKLNAEYHHKVNFARISLNLCKHNYLGDSEKNVADAIKSLQGLDLVVVLFDEFDKQSGHSLSGVDGTTSAGMLSLVLSYADDPTRKSFIIYTMNRLVGPAESLRLGRISAVIRTRLPGMEAKLEIARNCLHACNLKLPDNLPVRLRGFLRGRLSGAEVQALVEQAVQDASFAAGGPAFPQEAHWERALADVQDAVDVRHKLEKQDKYG
jgi:SpoVK/Ycf46/Vps4 family AAA+-type ATPase